MLTALTLMTLAAGAAGSASVTAPVAADTLFRGSAGQLDVAPPRIESPAVDLDGRVDEAVWDEAAVLSDFTQYEPVEGIPASEATEVRVFYSDDAIYFGVRAYDRDPSGILARLGERDRAVFSDDWVRIMLDTFNDQRQAYVFYVNPLGIQTDGLWIEGLRNNDGGGVSIDFNPDFLWSSEGRVTDDGWSAEIRIPFVSLRFREAPVQDWGLQVAREVRRSGFKQAWAPLTKDISSTLAQSGRLRGLRDLQPRRLVEMNPVLTGSRTGTLAESGAFVRSDPTGAFGLNGRVGVTQNLVLDATYNPDFSQVEADANQISVNERFALFFPEKRAFFLEGTEIFNTPARLVYTRQIVDPVAGAKLTGKVGAFTVGYIGAVDESPSSLLGGTGNALFNLVRGRRDVGAGSTVGFLYTDRTRTDGSGAFNRVVSGDARLVFGGRYTLTTQVAGSLTRDEDEAGHDGFRPLLSAELRRSGRTFAWNVGLTDVHPDFRARSGFIQRIGDAELNGSMSFTRFGQPGSLVESTSLRLNTGNFFTHDGLWNGRTPFEHEVELWPSVNFRGGRTLTLIFRNGYFRFEPEAYAAYGVQRADGGVDPFPLPGSLRNTKAFGLLPRIRVTDAVSLNGRMFLREVPIFVEAARGFETQIGPTLELRPTVQLQASLSYTYSRIRRSNDGPARHVDTGRPVDGSVFSTVNLSRLRLQYQFTRALLVRGVAQYQFEDRSALTDPTSGRVLTVDGTPVAAFESGEFQGQFLVQYEPSPGTIFYIGYSRLMEGDDRSYRLGTMRPIDEGLFVKLSYLFRM